MPGSFAVESIGDTGDFREFLVEGDDLKIRDHGVHSLSEARISSGFDNNVEFDQGRGSNLRRNCFGQLLDEDPVIWLLKTDRHDGR